MTKSKTMPALPRTEEHKHTWAKIKSSPVRLKAFRAKDRILKAKTRMELKLAVIKAYGGKCACCREKDHRFLTVDHKNGVGYRRRGSNGKCRRANGTTGIWAWLVANRFPNKDYQILCFNCNSGTYINGGICPHKDVR